MLSAVRTLPRPPPPAEDADDDAPPPPPTPVTFRMLDEHTPTLYVPCVAADPRATPLSGFPALGAYAAAAAVSPASGRYAAVVAADTLAPAGDAAAACASDRQFLWEVACAVGKRLDAFPAARVAARPASTAAAAVDALKEELKALRAPPAAAEAADAAADGDAAAAPPEDGGEEPPAEEAPAEEEEDAPEGEDDGDVEPAVKIGKLTKKVLPLLPSSHAEISRMLRVRERQLTNLAGDGAPA